ncbi:MAG: class I SAM-dependent methyltransferase [Actinomycetota bacterium]|nr:class I SAM-dependent methyltransferase [Actinomycetota bacterium]
MTRPGPHDEQLAAYAALLRSWAPRLDLVSPADLARLESRHIEDSLRALPLVDLASPGPGVDVGSGGGFPGIPLCIAGRSRSWRLLEPRSRRAAFLEEAIRLLELDAEVIVATAEEAASSSALTGHAVATARALASPEVAFALLGPLVRPDGLRIVWAGPRAESPPDAGVWEPGLLTMPPVNNVREKLE